MVTQSRSDLQSLVNSTIEIDVAINRAKRLLVDAEWQEDEETIKSLRNEIDRLERQKALGQTHDVLW
jgi:vacuolar-type H+-ATPase subunit D/Vma8